MPSDTVTAGIAFVLRRVGKPYQCVARTPFGWRQDGPRVPLAKIQPGDLTFSARRPTGSWSPRLRYPRLLSRYAGWLKALQWSRKEPDRQTPEKPVQLVPVIGGYHDGLVVTQGPRPGVSHAADLPEKL